MPVNAGQLFAQSIRWGALMSICQKLTSFVLNQLLIHRTNPEVVGMASIELELLLSTLLFLSREGIRLALLRQTVETSAQIQQFVNLSWTPCFVVMLLGLILHYFLSGSGGKIPTAVFTLYCVGATLEAVGEPWVNMYQNCAMMLPKMQAESVGVFCKSVVTFVAVAHLGLGVVGFGIAQVAYGIVYLAVLTSHTSVVKRADSAAVSMSWRQFLPGRVEKVRRENAKPQRQASSPRKLANLETAFLNQQSLSVALAATGSCLLKHVLTEADKIFLSLSHNHFDQGIFAIASNYASLVVRILFLPIEDSARVAFSKLLEGNERGKRQSRESKRQSRESISAQKIQILFTRLLRVVGLVGIVFPLFGPSYVHLAASYIVNAKWRGPDIEQTLVAFCFYIFLLGINGVSEAFVNVTASGGEGGFGTVNAGLVVSFAIYVAFSTLLVGRIGTSGVVYANTAAFLVRIASSSLSVSPRRSFVLDLLPSTNQAVTMVLSAAVCQLSARRFSVSNHGHRDALEHICLGVTVFSTLVALHRRALYSHLSWLRVGEQEF